MILWTIQPYHIYQMIQETGYYHCDFRKSFMYFCKPQYDWLASQMRKRIGNPPPDVFYPIWAWHTWQENRKKPDLRDERWHNGRKGDRFVRLEIDIPESDVLLSDFDDWSIILANGLLCKTEEEELRLEQLYDSLPPDEKKKMKELNWEGVFDLTPLKSDYMIRGRCIQATFWELKQDQIRKVTEFISAAVKPDYIDEE